MKLGRNLEYWPLSARSPGIESLFWRQHALTGIVPGRPLAIATSERFVESEATREIAAWRDEMPGGILVLAGMTGTGKTVEAARTLVGEVEVNLVNDDKSKSAEMDASGLCFLSAPRLARISRLSDEWRFLVGEEVDPDDGMGSFGIRMLVIDDLGVETASDGFLAGLDEIVDGFYSADPDLCRRLVITTNTTADEFEERYGVRVADRVRERGLWVPCLQRKRRIEEVSHAH